MSTTQIPGTGDSSSINYQTVINFLRFLDPDDKHLSYVIFNDSSHTPVPGYGLLHGDISSVVRLIREEPWGTGINWSLHVTLCRTNGRGRKSADIEAARVLCIDLDRKIDSYERDQISLDYKSFLNVESSPGKYHFYWKIEDIIPVVRWSKYQFALASKFDGDRGLSQSTHMIRVPGIPRLTKDGEIWIPNASFIAYTKVLSEADIGAVFPWLNEAYEAGKVKEREDRAKLRAALRVGLGGKGAALAGLKECEGQQGRNNILYAELKAIVSAIGFIGTYDELVEKAYELNRAFSTPLEIGEVLAVSKSAWDRGSGLRVSRETRIVEVKSLLGPLQRENKPGVEAHSVEIPIKVKKKRTESEKLIIRSKYSDLSILEQLVFKFSDSLLFKGRKLYAFSEIEHIWAEQRGSKAELYAMFKVIISEIVKSDEFLARFKESEGINAKRLAIELMRLDSAKTMNAVLNSVMHVDSIRRVAQEEFDNNGALFYVKNGVIDLGNSRIREPRAADLLIQQAQVEFNADAKCLGWKKFIREVFSENEDPEQMVNFIQEVFGYSLSGSISEQKLFCHLGDGSNGKSKVMSALSALVGGYGTIIEPEFMVRKRNGYEAAFERLCYRIEGKRVAIVDDLDVGGEWNEAFVKNLTGPRLRAREERAVSREIQNRCKFHIGMNEAPVPSAENNGILRRMWLIPYPRYFEHNSVISTAIDKMIVDEMPGILNWAIEGYKRIQATGLSEPDECRVAIQQYREKNFKDEGAVDGIFEVDDKAWMWASDVENALKLRGIEMNSEKLGKALKRKFGKISDKRWNAEKKNMFRGYILRIKQ